MNNVWRDTWLTFERQMRLSLRNPIWVALGLIQPLMYLALFGPLLKPVVANTPGLPPGDEWQVFAPGLLVQLGLFGAAFVGFGLVAEYRAGVIERQRVSPASRVSLLAGRVLRDVVVIVVQTLLLLAAAVPFGLRAPIAGVLLSLLIVAGLGAAFASLSYGCALLLKSEDALAPLLNGLAMPLLLLSGILLPMSLAPGWLRRLSDVNPLKHTVDATRSFFTGDLTSSAALWGSLATIGLVAVSLWFGARTFRRESA
ncbi:ABC transporter permease [Kineosporia babensis]|uniref:Transport permease protein n=1 Tax=Kineosporia babensis TaxID=499548 RepID=A0A9X1SVM7_9ACTN|nr:ABC transporter permease [Kineosporia babensis]MCD5313824.1 ABC transporter permease [Kineosporia babensis]